MSKEVVGTGDTASEGTYYCAKCGAEYKHAGDGELPRCPEEQIWTIWEDQKRPTYRAS